MQVKRPAPVPSMANPAVPFASWRDHAECRRLHRRYGTTYYFATQRFGRVTRRRVHALYGFVRVPDEWVDNPGTLSPERLASDLRGWRSSLLRGVDGVRPEHPVMRAFCDVVRETNLPLDEALLFLDAMESDLTVTRYATYEELRVYMRGSAAAVGVMMLHVLGADLRPSTHRAAQALGEAMQLTNFLRDVGEDARRGRLYLPLEDLASFGVTEEEVRQGVLSDRFVSLMRFEIGRARALYTLADEGIPSLPKECRKAVRLARILYARILDRIEARGYDVFSGRARTSKAEKLAVAAHVLLKG